MKEAHVVTCFLRHRGEVLLLRRSEKVGSYQGRWGAVAGYAEGDPDAAARREIAEETGLETAVKWVRSGEAFSVEDDALETRWIVHSYLFDCDHRDVTLNEESTEAAWVMPTEILRRETVPELWTAYEYIAPSIETICADTTHGSAYLSLRALEVLRDQAGRMAHDEGDTEESLADFARRLRDARVSMAAVRNRINRVMRSTASSDPADVERAAHAAIARALADDDEATSRAAQYVAGRRVFTLSRSDTVLQALLQADPPPSVIVAVSQPGGEGIGMAEALQATGLDVMLVADAAVVAMLTSEAADVVLVGTDAILPNGAVVNKVGTLAAALAARSKHIPFYAAAASDKVSTDAQPHLEMATPASLYTGDAELTLHNPLFDETPASLLSGIITEYGLLAPDEMRDLGYELKALETW